MYDPLIRFVRHKDAPRFFGVGLGKFNTDIRPHLPFIPMGNTPQSGIVYDVYDLHALADIMKERNGVPQKGDRKWDVKPKVPVLKLSKDRDLQTCISKAPSTEDELGVLLEQMMRRRQK